MPEATQPSMSVLYAGDIVQCEWMFQRMLEFLTKNIHSKDFKEANNIFQVFLCILTISPMSVADGRMQIVSK